MTMDIRKFIKLINVVPLRKSLVALTTGFSLVVFSTAPLHSIESVADLSEDFISSRFMEMGFMFEAEPNAHFHRRVRSLLTHNAHSAAMLNRMAVYMPFIEAELNERGLPEELKYLTITESGVNPVARSRAGAVGLWQIMLGTARHLGLRVNRVVDERRDPVAATTAAIDYLESLYEKYGDWKLALAAYNAGPGRVDQAVRRANSNDFEQVKRFLPLETRNYIPSFMASAYFGSFHQLHGIIGEVYDFDLVLTDVVRVYDQMSFNEIAKISGVDVSVIRKLNPMFLATYVPASRQGYNLILPRRGVAQMESRMSIKEGGEYLVDRKRVFEEYIESFYLVEREMSWIDIANLLYLNPYQLAYLNPSIPASGPVAGDQIRYVIPRFAGFLVKAVEDAESEFIRIEALKTLPYHKPGAVYSSGDYEFQLAFLDLQHENSKFRKSNPKKEFPDIETSRGQSRRDLDRLKRITDQRIRAGSAAFRGE
ncbi:MAG: hypothetical protein EA362_01765 [Saprospirales bacterium]|nr:MAG: hypothetical protein EA362_01765 [Saprospirales bacterium]